MDPKLLARYRSAQRSPVFLAGRPATKRPDRRFYALLIYAALLGFAVTGCAVITINGISNGSYTHHAVR